MRSLCGLALLLGPASLAAQSAATTGELIAAAAIEITTTTDTTWQGIKLRASGDCLAFVYTADPRGAAPRSFDGLRRARYRKKGQPADSWEEVQAAEIGAMKRCPLRQSR